jgi:hypothetical protein
MLSKASHKLQRSDIACASASQMTVNNNQNSAPAVGHGSGSGNGSVNNNSVEISLFSLKFEKKEEKKEEQMKGPNGGEVAVLVGGTLALGAAASWAIGKLLSSGEKKEATDERREESDPTTMEGVQRYLDYR